MSDKKFGTCKACGGEVEIDRSPVALTCVCCYGCDHERRNSPSPDRLDALEKAAVPIWDDEHDAKRIVAYQIPAEVWEAK